MFEINFIIIQGMDLFIDFLLSRFKTKFVLI